MRNILYGGARRVAADWGTALQTEVAGSIPDGVIGIFHWHNPSVRTIQSLTEMSTIGISWG